MSQGPAWIKRWDSFWFTPTSPVPIAVFRIIFGIILLEDQLVHLLPDFNMYYSTHNLIPIKEMIACYWTNDPNFDVLLCLPQDDRWLLGAFYIMVAATFLMTIGLYTRLSTWIVYFMMMSFGHHLELNQNAGDNYLRIVALCMAFSSAGDALSLDNLLRSFKQDWRLTGFMPVYSAPWAQRLIQIQLAIAYCHTFFCKISGFRWNDGYATYFATRYDDVQRFPLPHFVDQPWFYIVTTYGTLFVEFILWNLIWWKPARNWVILFGVLLHLGIEYCMNLPMFEWTFMLTYLLYYDGTELSAVWSKLKTFINAKCGEPYVLGFDSQSIMAIRAVGVMHRLDIFGRFDGHDLRETALQEALKNTDIEDQVLVRKRNGQWLSGFEAFRFMALRMPVLMPLAILLYIPILSLFAKAIYNAFAANRALFLADAPKQAKVASGGAAS